MANTLPPSSLNDQIVKAEEGTQEAHVSWAHAMCSRLAADPQLVLPSRMYQEAGGTPTTDQIHAYLAGLISRDPAAYLERYGKLLKPNEVTLFDQFSSDFEVAHWLRVLGATPPSAQAQEQQTEPACASGASSGPLHEAGAEPAPQPHQVQASPSSVGKQQAATAVQKNRRLAAMQNLQQQGDYFSEDTMRQRAPLLYHQLIGQYTGEDDPRSAGLRAAGAGARSFSEVLMRQHEELAVMQQLEEEQRMEEEQMSEHDSDEEGEEEGVEDRRQAAGAGPSATAEQALDGEGELSACAAKKVISAAQLARNRAEFQQEMELRFLYGRDTHVDYAAIDADVDGQLDAHWAKEAGRDAEDAYFGDTDDEDAGAGQQDGTARSGADEEHSMDYDY